MASLCGTDTSTDVRLKVIREDLICGKEDSNTKDL